MTLNITAVRNPFYNPDGSVSMEACFGDATNNDGTPHYSPLTVHDDEPYSDGALLLADIRAGKYGELNLTAPPGLLFVTREQKRAEINTWRNQQENSEYLMQYDGRRWDYGKKTQERMSISLAMAKRNALPEGFAWTDGDNNIVPMTSDSLIALAEAIEQAMFEKGIAINTRQLQMKAELEALNEYTAIRDYVVGWSDNPEEKQS
ncbi:DUF4376 domain-containing protein [Salmonella enterica]|nr:DUF4376 domain-containing protein [Salmonella enterica]EDU0818285.1 DUF4376 domain-containing protein [Salmonella enterica subsp. diarizonae serovar 61:l,[v],[z13]:1,5,[7]]